MDGIAAAMPELPGREKARFVEDARALSEYDAGVLTAEVENADYFEAVAQGRDGAGRELVINELFGRLNKEGLTSRPRRSRRAAWRRDRPDRLRERFRARSPRTCSRSFWTEGGDPARSSEARGMKQVTDLGAIEARWTRSSRREPGAGRKARANPKLAGWFVGQVLKAGGRPTWPRSTIWRRSVGASALEWPAGWAEGAESRDRNALAGAIKRAPEMNALQLVSRSWS